MNKKPVLRLGFNKKFKQIERWLNFVSSVKPVNEFSISSLPSPPDYAIKSHWAALPDVYNKSELVPEGELSVPTNDRVADVFFVHPTTHFGKQWNAAIDDQKSSKIVDEVIMPSQASVFNRCCRIFAPRYRQATFYSFYKGTNSGRKALELAYEDVKKAFYYYMEHYNDGRPFFIGSHSQGTLHAVRLLEEVIDHSEYARQLVAAYVLGFRFPKAKAFNMQQLHVCRHEKDIHCLIGWDSYLDGANPFRYAKRLEHFYNGKWKRIRKRPVLGINPLRWTNGTALAPKDLNLGAVSVIFERNKLNLAGLYRSGLDTLEAKRLSPPFPGEVSAQLRKNGILYISRPHHRHFRMLAMPFNNYHHYDFTLFYMNIRKNICDRLQAFLGNQ